MCDHDGGVCPMCAPLSTEYRAVRVGHCDWWSGWFRSTRLARWRWRIHLLSQHGKWSDYMNAGYAE